MANATNLTIGACSVTWKGIDLGHTSGGVTFTVDQETEDIKADKYTGPVDIALTAEDLQVVINIAETKSVDIMRHAYAGSEYDTAAGTSQIKFGRDTGYLIGAGRGGELQLHPLKNSSSDRSEDVYIYTAVPVGSVELNYEVDGQRIAEVTFRATVKTAYGSAETGEGYLGRIGPAIT